MNETLLHTLIAFFILLILAAIAMPLFGVKSKTETEFTEACQKVGGTPVWDRKQWQCLK
jgi:hypothetical protein